MSEGELLRGWLVSLTRHVAIGVLGIAWLALIARTLTAEEVGALILVVALPSLLGPLLNLGFPLGVSVLTARRTYRFDDLLAWARKTGLQLAGGSALLMILAATAARAFLAEVNYLVFWGLLTVPLAIFCSIGAAFFQGQRMFGRQAQILVAPMALTTGVTVVLIGGWDPSATTLLRVVVASHTATAAWVFWQLRGKRLDPGIEQAIRREAWALAWRAYFSEGAAAVRARLDLVLVGAALGTVAAASFGTATALASQVAILSMAAYQVTLPFAASTSSPEADCHGDLTPITARSSVVLTLFAALLLAVFCQPLLHIFYGEEFVDGWPVLLAYLPSVVLLSMSRILTADLSGRGEMAVVLRISLQATAFGLIAIPLAIAVWGTTGAAIGTSITALVNTALRVRAYHVVTNTPISELVRPRRSDFTVFVRAARQWSAR